jgi:hypothetical protein
VETGCREGQGSPGAVAPTGRQVYCFNIIYWVHNICIKVNTPSPYCVISIDIFSYSSAKIIPDFVSLLKLLPLEHSKYSKLLKAVQKTNYLLFLHIILN